MSLIWPPRRGRRDDYSAGGRCLGELLGGAVRGPAELDRQLEDDVLEAGAEVADLGDAAGAEPAADVRDEPLRRRSARRHTDDLGLLRPGLVDLRDVVDQVRVDAGGPG